MRDSTRRLFGASVAAAAAWLLAGCATPRPEPGLSCNLHGQAVRAPVRLLKAVPPRSIPDWDEAQTQIAVDLRIRIQQNFADRQEIKRVLRPVRPAPPGAPPPPPPPSPGYVVLMLSAGGQFGAYGSGFLKGWGDRSALQPPRADVDMITGVSTGAMMATYAYLGSSENAATRTRYDDLLKAQYTTLTNGDVFRPRSPIEYLWANSIYDASPLHARLEAQITDDLLAAVITEADDSKRLLYVGAVNADTGLFEYFDLIAIARDTSHDRRKCYAAALLASAAIPAAFNPVFINGQMYVDGGARQNAFFVAQVAAALPGQPKTLLGILHGDLNVPPTTTKNNLIGVVGRTTTIASDQLVLDAAYYVDSEARRRNFATRWTSAANTACETQANDDMFSPALGLCLWNTGHARARDEPVPWKEFSQIRQP
ncbi:MAG TPA: patatin-like phospholipase family protein [Burkholderiaceae bacterium]|nr:patatin-like phospholipase family protein [Burkholderiaceae bacterium]